MLMGLASYLKALMCCCGCWWEKAAFSSLEQIFGWMLGLSTNQLQHFLRACCVRHRNRCWRIRECSWYLPSIKYTRPEQSHSLYLRQRKCCVLDCCLTVIFVVNKVHVWKFLQVYTTTHIPSNRDIWFNLSILLSIALLMTFIREGEAIMVKNVILRWVTPSET